MISRYHGTANRIRKELAALDRLVARADRAIALARRLGESFRSELRGGSIVSQRFVY